MNLIILFNHCWTWEHWEFATFISTPQPFMNIWYIETYSWNTQYKVQMIEDVCMKPSHPDMYKCMTVWMVQLAQPSLGDHTVNKHSILSSLQNIFISSQNILVRSEICFRSLLLINDILLTLTLDCKQSGLYSFDRFPLWTLET